MVKEFVLARERQGDDAKKDRVEDLGHADVTIRVLWCLTDRGPTTPPWRAHVHGKPSFVCMVYYGT